jgi:hypothetical protein
MSSIFKVKHCPKLRVRIRFRYLIQWRIILIYDLVDWAHDPRILDGPAQIPTGFASYYIAFGLTLVYGWYGC